MRTPDPTSNDEILQSQEDPQTTIPVEDADEEEMTENLQDRSNQRATVAAEKIEKLVPGTNETEEDEDLADPREEEETSE
jgi:hypothetical protein